MALDGITISALVHELNTKLTGGRFFKIAQPETDELQITVKQAREQYRIALLPTSLLAVAIAISSLYFAFYIQQV